MLTDFESIRFKPLSGEMMAVNDKDILKQVASIPQTAGIDK